MKFISAEWRKLIMANYEIDPVILKKIFAGFNRIGYMAGETLCKSCWLYVFKYKSAGHKDPFSYKFS